MLTGGLLLHWVEGVWPDDRLGKSGWVVPAYLWPPVVGGSSIPDEVWLFHPTYECQHLVVLCLSSLGACSSGCSWHMAIPLPRAWQTACPYMLAVARGNLGEGGGVSWLERQTTCSILPGQHKYTNVGAPVFILFIAHQVCGCNYRCSPG